MPEDTQSIEELIALIPEVRSGKTLPDSLVERHLASGQPCLEAGVRTLVALESYGDASRCHELVQLAIDIYTRHDCPPNELMWNAYNLFGKTCDDYLPEQAIVWWKRAEQIALSLELHRAIAVSSANIGYWAVRNNEIEVAAHRAWILQSHRSADPVMRAMASRVLAVLFRAFEMHTAAMVHFRQYCLEAMRSGDQFLASRGVSTLYDVFARAGFSEACRRLEHKLDAHLDQTVDEVATVRIANIALALATGDMAGAESALARVRNTEGGIPSSFWEPKLPHLEAVVALKKGEAARALAALEHLGGEGEGGSTLTDTLRLDAYRMTEDWVSAYRQSQSIVARYAKALRQATNTPHVAAIIESLTRAVTERGDDRSRLISWWSGVERVYREQLNNSDLIGHELRNMVAPFVLLIDGLAASRSEEVIAQVSEGLAGTLTDLRVLSSDTGFASNGSQTPIDVGQLAADVVLTVRPIASRKHTRIELEAGPSAQVSAVNALVQLCLVNLVDNAVKYSPPGSLVTIGWAIDANGAVSVCVNDEGPGFSKADMARAFRPRQKLSARPTAGEASTGLGLFIARRIVRRFGAEIHLESRGDGRPGATVRVTFPAPAIDAADTDVVAETDAERLSAPATASDAAVAEPSSASDRRGTALVVEDNPLLARAVVLTLSAEGWKPLVASSFEVAIAVIDSTVSIDVALVDMVLAGVRSGQDVVVRLRERRPDTAIVITSSRDPHEIRSDPRLVDIPLVSKPYAWSDLIKTIDSVLALDWSPPTERDVATGDADAKYERWRELRADAARQALVDPEAGVEAWLEVYRWALTVEFLPGVAAALHECGQLYLSMNRFGDFVQHHLEFIHNPVVDEQARLTSIASVTDELRERGVPGLRDPRDLDGSGSDSSDGSPSDGSDGSDDAASFQWASRRRAEWLAASGRFREAVEVCDEVSLSLQTSVRELLSLFPIANELATAEAVFRMNDLAYANEHFLASIDRLAAESVLLIEKVERSLVRLQRELLVEPLSVDRLNLIVESVMVDLEADSDYRRKLRQGLSMMSGATALNYLIRSLDRSALSRGIVIAWDAEHLPQTIAPADVGRLSWELREVVRESPAGCVLEITLMMDSEESVRYRVGEPSFEV